jgi:predicted kinase
MLCGKIASGKSTLAHSLSAAPRTIRLSEDDWLAALFGDQMTSVKDYVACAAKLRGVMAPHVVSLLRAGLSVVLDFPANTVAQRAWMRDVARESAAAHVLHFLDVPDAVCLARLKARNAGGEHAFAATEEQFRLITAHFVPPSEAEGFNLRRVTSD